MVRTGQYFVHIRQSYTQGRAKHRTVVVHTRQWYTRGGATHMTELPTEQWYTITELNSGQSNTQDRVTHRAAITNRTVVIVKHWYTLNSRTHRYPAIHRTVVQRGSQ